jgi:hypothetical protein
LTGVNEERLPGAMPKLYGAPAYARPPIAPVNPIERPFDPDDLPLEAERSDEEDGDLGHIPSRPYESVATTAPLAQGHDAASKLHGRPFRIRLPGRPPTGR